MDFVNSLPIWALALLIFALRVFDVSLGTVRTISVVQGRTALSVGLGFVEVLVWIVAVSQVITRIGESPILAVAYAGGFATGNAVGILIDRRLALGTVEIRIISRREGVAIAEALRAQGQVVTTFTGEGRDGPRTLVFVIAPRRHVETILAIARNIDAAAVHVVERASDSHFHVFPDFTGWRARSKKK